MANELSVLEAMRAPQTAPAEAVTPAPEAVAPGAAPAPAPAPAPEASGDIPDIFETLPNEVKALPIIKLLSIGEPPAVLIEPGQYFPQFEPIGRNLPAILRAGLDFYKSKNGESVLFNPIFIDEAELKKADETDKLTQIVPSYGELMGEEPEAIPDDKFAALLKQNEENDIAFRQLSAAGPDETGAEAVPPPPAGVEAEMMQARAGNVKPMTPTSRAMPGAGAVINGLMKRAV